MVVESAAKKKFCIYLKNWLNRIKITLCGWKLSVLMNRNMRIFTFFFVVQKLRSCRNIIFFQNFIIFPYAETICAYGKIMIF